MAMAQPFVMIATKAYRHRHWLKANGFVFVPADRSWRAEASREEDFARVQAYAKGRFTLSRNHSHPDGLSSEATPHDVTDQDPCPHDLATLQKRRELIKQVAEARRRRAQELGAGHSLGRRKERTAKASAGDRTHHSKPNSAFDKPVEPEDSGSDRLAWIENLKAEQARTGGPARPPKKPSIQYRRVAEPLGTRDDWKKDRAANWQRAIKPKFP